MVAIQNISARTVAACILALACTACGAAVQAPGVADGSSEGVVQVVDRLPLQPGYYVAADTPCAEASNASLHLRREDGSGYGGFTTPPYSCEYERIEQVGPTRYRAVQTCGDASGEGDPDVRTTVYEILGETSYSANNDDGWESSARRCPRRALPSPWRDESIGDFVE